jgi:glycyl-tRNA synthetase
MPARIDMAKFAKFCKDNGFIFQSSEIYGGLNGFWDYGPLGVELKKNIKDAWWQDMVRNPPPGPDGKEIRMVGLDCSIIMNPKVWVASGHVGGFSDPMVGCKTEGCKKLYRADKLFLVSIWPLSSITNREQVETNQAAPVVAGNCLHTVAMEGEFRGIVGLAKNAIKQFGQKNKIAELRKLFGHDGDKQFGPASTFFLGSFLEPGEDEEPDPNYVYKFGCVIEPLLGAKYSSGSRPCPACQSPNSLTEPRAFNLMFESHAGAIQSDENKVYLRPETAQGIFVNFKNVLDSTRLKLPFGIAQVGKAFRNEVNPRNFTFRSREFEQMEIEFFCHPVESMKWYEYWRDLRKRWYSQLGIKSDNLRPREQGKDELAHYSIGTTDIEYLFPFSDEPQELEGVAHRGAFDLTAHATHSGLGDKLGYFDQDAWMADAPARSTNSFEQWLKTASPTKEQVEKYKFFPHVIEPSAGADRFTLAVLCEAYHEDKVPDASGKLEERIVMRFHPRLAPVKAAIFPLVNKDGMPEKALALYRELKPHFNVFFDDKGAVGRRYRRQDEVGTPYCITIDGDTTKDDTVTIRDRDTLQQRRVKLGQVKDEIQKGLAAG